MIISVSTLNGKVAGHFGRCTTFTIFKTENKKIIEQKEIPNPYFKNPEIGEVPKLINSLKADVIIAEDAGPLAIECLKKLKIKMVFGVKGDVRKVVEDYLSGNLKIRESTCTH